MADTTTQTVETGPAADFFSIWRPLLGYVCVASFIVIYVINPFLAGISAFKGHPMALPVIDTATLAGLVTTASVSVGVRTFEKVMNVNNSH